MARYRFGIFDFDPGTRELKRDGFPVRLQAQPAQALAVLLANAGEVVARETLQRDVWGGETFVDFERGLNFCIAQIRTALGDSAESPRFVKTLPKRGYQFIAPVEVEGRTAAAAEPARSLALAPAPTSALPPRRSRLWIGAVLTVASSAGLLLWLRPWTAPPAQPPSATVAVLHFDNETGSADFDRFTQGLTDTVVTELTSASAGRYSVIGNAAILRTPRPQRDMVVIGASLGAGYIVLGQVFHDQTKSRVLAHLIRLPEQKHLSVVRMDGSFDDPLRFQAELAQKVAAQFGPRIAADAARKPALPAATSD